MAIVPTDKHCGPSCSNRISPVCRLLPRVRVVSSPVYLSPKKTTLQLSLWLSPLTDHFYSLQLVEVNVSVKLTVLKYSQQRGIKLQLMLILVMHACVSRSYVKSRMESLCCRAEQMKHSKLHSYRPTDLLSLMG